MDPFKICCKNCSWLSQELSLRSQVSRVRWTLGASRFWGDRVTLEVVYVTDKRARAPRAEATTPRGPRRTGLLASMEAHSLVKLPMAFSGSLLVFFLSFFKKVMYLYICIYVVCCARKYMVVFYTCVVVEARVGLGAFSQPLLYLIFWDMVCHWTWSSLIGVGLL